MTKPTLLDALRAGCTVTMRPPNDWHGYYVSIEDRRAFGFGAHGEDATDPRAAIAHALNCYASLTTPAARLRTVWSVTRARVRMALTGG